MFPTVVYRNGNNRQKKMISTKAALLIVDVQKAIDHPSWEQRNNPQAEKTFAVCCRNGISTLMICGVITGNSIEATAQMAGDPGYETYVISDATVFHYGSLFPNTN